MWLDRELKFEHRADVWPTTQGLWADARSVMVLLSRSLSIKVRCGACNASYILNHFQTKLVAYCRTVYIINCLHTKC